MLRHLNLGCLLVLLTIQPGWSRCACMDSPEEIARQAKENAAIHNLVSENDLSIARNFQQQQLFDDAAEYYLKAAKDAEDEAARATPGSTPPTAAPAELQALSVTKQIEHSAAVERTAADFMALRSRAADAAHFQEQALGHELALKKDVDLAQEYAMLAHLFESANERTKAAEYYHKLFDYFSANKGRYADATKAAWASYQRLLHSSEKHDRGRIAELTKRN